MKPFEIRAIVDRGKNVVLTLISGEKIAVGVQDTDETNLICISKTILQDAFDGKRTMEAILADKSNYTYLPLTDIASISE
jgi:hypothetical protein